MYVPGFFLVIRTMKVEYVYFGLIGLVIGAISSWFLNIHSENSVDLYSRAIFGMNSATFIKGVSIFFTCVIISLTAWLSFLIRDLDYPKENPIYFTIETLLAGIIPATFLLYMFYTRGTTNNQILYSNFPLLALKLMLAHILLQFSGVYSSVFKNMTNK